MQHKSNTIDQLNVSLHIFLFICSNEMNLISILLKDFIVRIEMIYECLFVINQNTNNNNKKRNKNKLWKSSVE